MVVSALGNTSPGSRGYFAVPYYELVRLAHKTGGFMTVGSLWLIHILSSSSGPNRAPASLVGPLIGGERQGPRPKEMV